MAQNNPMKHHSIPQQKQGEKQMKKIPKAPQKLL